MHFAKNRCFINALQVVLFLSLAIHAVIIDDIVAAVYAQRIHETVTKIIVTLFLE